MIRAAALATLLLSGCVTAPTTPGDDGARACDVAVTFGSYAMGIDAELKTRILALVVSDPDVSDSQERPWGREGESDLCIQTSTSAAADRLFDQIADWIPQYSERAPTTVTHIDGRTDASGPPPGWN